MTTPGPRLATLLSTEQIALDTMIFVYEFQEDPRYIQVTEKIFNSIRKGEMKAMTSAITLAELLVLPYKQGNTALAEELRNRILSHPNLKIIPVDADIAEWAAKLRSSLPLRLPDCIQFASAATADHFLTNDRRFEKLKTSKIVILEDLIS